MSLLLLLNPDSQRPSARFVRAAFRQSTDEVVVVLLTITHPNLEPPARICSDTVDLVSRGETFLGGVPFEVNLPDDDAETMGSVRLMLSVIDQELVATIRSIPPNQPPKVTMELCLAETPDIIENGPYDFTLRGVEGDIATIEGDLSFEDMLHEPFPGDNFIPSTHPALF